MNKESKDNSDCTKLKPIKKSQKEQHILILYEIKVKDKELLTPHS